MSKTRIHDRHTRQVLKQLPKGYELRMAPSGHHVLHGPDGTPVRMENGLPVTVGNTPSDWRSHKNFTAVLKRIGLL